jgi:hypothetical protein
MESLHSYEQNTNRATLKRALASDPRLWDINPEVATPALTLEAQVLSVLDGGAPLAAIDSDEYREKVRTILISDCASFDELFSALLQIGDTVNDYDRTVVPVAARINAILEFRTGRRSSTQPLFMDDPLLEEKVRELTITENDTLGDSPFETQRAA